MKVTASARTGIERRSPRPNEPLEAPVEEIRACLPAVTVAPRRAAPEQEFRIRPLAGVVAQLVATAGGHPVTRARRRAEPAEAANLYQAGMAPIRPRPLITLRIV